MLFEIVCPATERLSLAELRRTTSCFETVFARVFELFFLDIPGFSGFLLLGYPVCEPQKLSRFFMNSQALLLSAFRIFP